MTKILRNYYFENKKCIILNVNGLFPEAPHALCDLGKEYKEPVPIELENKQIVMFEKSELEKMLEEQKKKQTEKQFKKEKSVKEDKK